MAQSDTYFATKKEALAELRTWGAKVSSLKPDGGDCWSVETDDGFGYVYLERIQVQPTCAGIAHALKHIPHR